MIAPANTGKESNNKKAVIYAESHDGKRVILNSRNPVVIKEMENVEWVGKKITFKNGCLV